MSGQLFLLPRGCHGTGTFGSALPFRSHIRSTGAFTSSVVATTQDGQQLSQLAKLL